MKTTGTMKGGSLTSSLVNNCMYFTSWLEYDLYCFEDATYLLKCLQGFHNNGITLYAISIQVRCSSRMNWAEIYRTSFNICICRTNLWIPTPHTLRAQCRWRSKHRSAQFWSLSWTQTDFLLSNWLATVIPSLDSSSVWLEINMSVQNIIGTMPPLTQCNWYVNLYLGFVVYATHSG